MGQRTNIIVEEHVQYDVYDKEIGKYIEKPDLVKVFLYHNQWGYGDRMLKDAMSYILQRAVSGRDMYSNEEIQTLKAPQHLWTAHLEDLPSWCDKESISILENTEIKTYQDIQDIERMYCDNNNGCIFLRIYRDKYNIITGGQYYILKGPEDCAEGELEFSRCLTLKEYQDMWARKDDKGNTIYDCDPQIVASFRALCRYYNIKAGRLGTRTDGVSYVDRIEALKAKNKTAEPVIAPQL